MFRHLLPHHLPDLENRLRDLDLLRCSRRHLHAVTLFTRAISHIQAVAVEKKLIGSFPGAGMADAATSISHEHIAIDKSCKLIGEWSQQK